MRDAAVNASTARRGRLSEREWADVERAARLARKTGVMLKVHGVHVTGFLKQKEVAKTTAHKVLQPQADAAVPQAPPTRGSETPPPSLSKRQQRSQQRLQEFQQQKLEKQARHMAVEARRTQVQQAIARNSFAQPDMRELTRRAMLRLKLRSIFRRAWRQYRPFYGGRCLGYLSLKEQRVYRRAASLYSAAFALDPSASGRSLAAWLRHTAPMEMETDAVAASAGGQPPKRAKKSHGGRAQAPVVASRDRGQVGRA